MGSVYGFQVWKKKQWLHSFGPPTLVFVSNLLHTPFCVKKHAVCVTKNVIVISKLEIFVSAHSWTYCK